MPDIISDFKEVFGDAKAEQEKSKTRLFSRVLCGEDFDIDFSRQLAAALMAPEPSDMAEGSHRPRALRRTRRSRFDCSLCPPLPAHHSTSPDAPRHALRADLRARGAIKHSAQAGGSRNGACCHPGA